MIDPGRTHKPIGWIGVGKMGEPMANRLVEAGHSVTICDPVAENRASLVARGAKVAHSLAELAGTSEIVFSTIPHDAALTGIVYGDGSERGLIDHMRQGSIFIEMSTVSPQLSERIAGDLASRGIVYLSCPISGSTALARTGTLTALASGSAKAWEEASDLIDLLATRKFYLGAHEEARYMKLVLNILIGTTSAIIGEALLLGQSGGLTPAQMMDVIVESAASSPLIKYKRDMIDQMDFTPAFSMAQMTKDFLLITEAGRQKRVPMSVTNLVLQQYMTASNSGHAERDFFALFDWMRGENQVRDLV